MKMKMILRENAFVNVRVAAIFNFDEKFEVLQIKIKMYKKYFFEVIKKRFLLKKNNNSFC